MKNCKNCNELINSNYCSSCGRPATLRRVDFRYIISEIGDVLHTKRGFFYTIKKILISPGDTVREFLIEDRYRLVKPITFLFITSLIYTLVSHYFKIDAKDYQVPPVGETEFLELPTANLLIQWIIDYQGYANLITSFFIAFFVKLFFRKSGYNLFEIFVLLCFISGIASFCFSIILIFQGLTQVNLIQISSFISVIYYIWAIGHFFDKKKAISYIKATLSCALGLFIFCLIVMIVVMYRDFDIILEEVNKQMVN
jgi:hypothetical protein